jgi:hypothetical protein
LNRTTKSFSNSSSANTNYISRNNNVNYNSISSTAKNNFRYSLNNNNNRPFINYSVSVPSPSLPPNDSKPYTLQNTKNIQNSNFQNISLISSSSLQNKNIPPSLNSPPRRIDEIPENNFNHQSNNLSSSFVSHKNMNLPVPSQFTPQGLLGNQPILNVVNTVPPRVSKVKNVDQFNNTETDKPSSLYYT